MSKGGSDFKTSYIQLKISAFDFDYSHFDQSNFARKPIKIANVNANNVINDFLESAMRYCRK